MCSPVRIIRVFDPARTVVSGQTCSKYSNNQCLYSATMSLISVHLLGSGRALSQTTESALVLRK